LAKEGALVLGDRPLVHVPQLEDALSASSLRSEGIEAVIPIRSGRQELGLVLLAGDPRAQPCADPELEFFALIANQAGTALHNAQLTQRLLINERHASTGRVAVVLAHDMGKELDWLGRIVRRLPQRLNDRIRLERDVSMAVQLAEGLVEGVRAFVKQARSPEEDSSAASTADEVFDACVRRMARIHGKDRISQSISPEVRAVRVDENLARPLSNLLDNALLATPENNPIQLYATLLDGQLVISVDDRGCGIPPEIVSKVFDPGFTTRSDAGGFGVGLTVAREVIQELGGTLTLTPREGGGTSARLHLPMLPNQFRAMGGG
jgi:signal transduction histidine kinase